MRIFAACMVLAVGALAASAAPAEEADPWAGYLDYAYVFSSAEPGPLRVRLAEYGNEAGLTLRQYIERSYKGVPVDPDAADEVAVRRRAIAYFLDYLSSNEPSALEHSVDAVQALEGRLERHENRYWYRYVLAHRALEKGRRYDFVAETLSLWSEVVVPLESTYETLQTLSLDRSANAGFASALPYVYENVARLVLIRSPRMGVDRDLDPLGALVRLLLDGRVGAYPDVIPPAASSREHLARIVQRLDGAESDGGSLSFTLALFEAARYHERARALLAREGLGGATLDAIRTTTGAYQTAHRQASLAQGEVAVMTRVLRQLGEIHAAKQRLDADPEIEMPFQLEDAYDLYEVLYEGRRDDDWKELGYAVVGRDAWIQAMRDLWSELQEATLTVADYHLHRSVEAPHRAYEHSRAAARLYGRYLDFFVEHVTAEMREGVPESAYFAAHESAKGIGDAYLLYDSHPSKSEIELAIKRYRAALQLFPFDRTLWSSLAAALESQGREGDYLEVARAAGARVSRSRVVDTWIQDDEADSARIEAMRHAVADSFALVYLGFADDAGLAQLENDAQTVRAKREKATARLAELRRRREGPGPAKRDPKGGAGGGGALDAAERARLDREIGEATALLDRLDRQSEARARTLPIYKASLQSAGLADEMRARRDHPVHTLLRRMFHEAQE